MDSPIDSIISCDWGTSALRLRLVDTASATVLAEVTTPEGIANTFEAWKKTGKGEEERIVFYQSKLSEQIIKLEQQLRHSLDHIPLVISGMASSNIGMIELPYKEVPFAINEPGLTIKKTEATTRFKHSILLISGVKTNDDAMRGEETQLTGCLNENQTGEQLFIFPGTHSKHVRVKDQFITGIKTYMTGEFFELLSTKSILSSSIERGKGFDDEANKKGFTEGVKTSRQSNLLHNSFLARTNHLFKKLTKQENYYYLSGLIIGTELGEIPVNNNPITLVAAGEMQQLYSAALHALQAADEKKNVGVEDPDWALVKGQLKVLKYFDGNSKLA